MLAQVFILFNLFFNQQRLIMVIMICFPMLDSTLSKQGIWMAYVRQSLTFELFSEMQKGKLVLEKNRFLSLKVSRQKVS